MLSLLLLAGVAQAQIASVKVLGSTNVQALLSYQSSVDDACSVQVSDRPDFGTLVHDVDPSIFPGADSDSRAGNYSDGRNRIFVIGSRSVAQGADSNWYSRALQTDTTHYFRIRCGNDSANGAFRTANLPAGATYPWAIPQDPQTGNFRWPTLNAADRNQTIVDPNYGTLIRRLTMPGDNPDPDVQGWKKQFTAASGKNWTNPSASLADDGNAAVYAGNTQDWLAVTKANVGLTPFYTQNDSIGSLVFSIKGSAQGNSDDDRSIDVCVTTDGGSCRGPVRTAVLDGSVKTFSDLDEGLFTDDLNRDTFGLLIRAHNASGSQIAIDSVQLQLGLSIAADMPNGGFGRVCSPVKSNGGYHCAFPSSNGNVMYWINPDTGESRWLGKIVATGWGGSDTFCKSDFALWDYADPNSYYCGAKLNDRTVLLKGSYSGNDAAASPGDAARMSWSNLTPAGQTISELVQQYAPDFDPGKFGCQVSFMVNQFAVFQCLMGDQNSIGWLAVFDTGNGKPLNGGGDGRIVAAAKSFASPNTRWCGLHTPEYVGDINWIGWSANILDGSRPGPGQGPYTVSLAGSAPAQTGQMTIQVSGEPSSPGGQDPLMAAQAGDVFAFNTSSGYDFVRIVQKISATQWVVDRKVVNSTPAFRNPGEKLTAFCNATSLDVPDQGPDAYWNFVSDPKAQDASGQNWVVERQLTGGHIVERGNYRIMAHYQGYQVVTPGIPNSWNRQPSYKVLSNPRWDNARAAVGMADDIDGLGNTYQQHLSYENYKAAGSRGNWFVDFIPFIGTSGVTSSLSPVPGASQVFKANGTNLHRGQFPTLAVCGGRQLKDVSPGPITDQNAYSYCVGGACASGAGGSDVFINCPQPVSAQSHCDYSFGGKEDNVCVTDLAPYGQSVTQFYLDSSGMRNRVLTNALMPVHSPHTPLSLETAYALPDGSWVIFPGWGNSGTRGLFMVKVPNQPTFDSDPLKYSRSVQTSVTVTPSDGGARKVVMQYGSNSDTRSSASPVDCSAGQTCSVTVNVRPMELLFTKPQYNDGSGQAVGQGKVIPQFVTGAPGANLPAPKFTAPAMVNGASYEPKLAPGSIVSVFGDNLANCDAQAAALPLPASLCGASITINGQTGFLRAASVGQLDFQMPDALPPAKDATAIVGRDGMQSDPVTIPGTSIAAVAPAIYFYTFGDQNRRAVVINPDGTTNGPDRPDLKMHPLHPGDAAMFYANGLGPTKPDVPAGQPAPSDNPAVTQFPVQVVVNGAGQNVAFAGLAPGYAGIYQVNFTLDPSTPVNPDGQNQIWLIVNGVESPHVLLSLAN